MTSAGRKRRKLSESQKKKIKTAITVGAVAAGTALAAYGAYKLNQKSVKALIESYSDVGNVFLNFANGELANLKLYHEDRIDCKLKLRKLKLENYISNKTFLIG